MDYYDGQIITDHTAFANWTNAHGNTLTDRANGDGTYTVYLVPGPSEEEIKANRIAVLKDLLAQDDYKIRKCAEYNLLGLEMPYDVNEIHERNEAWRAEINELEK